MKDDKSTVLDELWQYEFIRFIKRKRKRSLTRLLLEGVYLFVPQNEALPYELKYSDIGDSWYLSVMRRVSSNEAN